MRQSLSQGETALGRGIDRARSREIEYGAVAFPRAADACAGA